jgi:hypothetical protein
VDTKFRFALDFRAADSLLLEAHAGNLSDRGTVTLSTNEALGPLVEVAMAREHAPHHYAAVTIEDMRLDAISAALSEGAICGTHYQDVFGVFPLAKWGLSNAEQDVWDQWCMRFANSAVAAGFPRNFGDSLAGAMGELQDNVIVHSDRPETGIVAFSASQGRFEFVVADRGVGVLASLQRNPRHAALVHAGAALQVAIADGGTRFESESGHGTGIGQLFRALAGQHGDIRFRSDDHALTVSGNDVGPKGTHALAQKARLPGLTISIVCRTGPAVTNHQR